MSSLAKWLAEKLEKALKKLIDKLTPPPLIKYHLPFGTLSKSPGNSCYDIASIDETFELASGSRVLVSTGLIVELPENYELQVRPRSGNAIKYGITVLNTPGTIDSSYRGEVKIIVYNASNKPFLIEKGARIAQIYFNKIDPVNLKLVPISEIVLDTDRGTAGFGSSGLK